MEIRTLAATSVDGRAINQEAITDFSGKMAGVCYMKDSLDDLMHEPAERTLKRAQNALERFHHSVFGHESVTLYLESIPKILAMVLNNEKYYNTSEKSARYTVMKTSGKEEELYFKWREIFTKEISAKYPDMDIKMVEKYALENARYLISVFTPSTNMVYTTSVQQLNYIVGWMNDFIASRKSTPGADGMDFDQKLADVFLEFVNKIDQNIIIPGLTDPKGRELSLFGKRKRDEEWGENYCYSYYGSFAQLAQAQRHRTLCYEFMFPHFDGSDLFDKPAFYIPEIIRDERHETEWLDDAKKLTENYPQGTMIRINERGTCENFILKCSERLCGQAQLEICQQTTSTLVQYYWGTKSEAVRNYLEPYVSTPRCLSFDMPCKKPCYFGPDQIFNRLV